MAAERHSGLHEVIPTVHHFEVVPDEAVHRA
jgi:hypothetical protein